MNRPLKLLVPALCVSIAPGLLSAQKHKEIPAADVVSRSIKAVGYEVGGGATKIIFVGTSAAPQASGEAKVDAKKAGHGYRPESQSNATADHLGRGISDLRPLDHYP